MLLLTNTQNLKKSEICFGFRTYTLLIIVYSGHIPYHKETDLGIIEYETVNQLLLVIVATRISDYS